MRSAWKNCWLLVQYRRLNQWARRTAIRWVLSRTAGVKRLKRERISLASRRTLTDQDRERLQQINWALGCGGVIRLTQEELEEQTRIANEILAEDRS